MPVMLASCGGSSTSAPISSSVPTPSVYFKCTFVNYDYSLLYSYDVEQGKDASYPYADPTKPSGASYSYIFSGWDKSLFNIQVDTTFKAQYTPYDLNALTYEYVSSTTSCIVSDCIREAVNDVIPSKYDDGTNGLHNVTSIGDYAFSACSSLTIYCEAESQPSGWNIVWNISGGTAYWFSETQPTGTGNYWHYDADGKPAIWA